jgi:acyl-[acyl-carrier-protein]-phospholipid O-acyltransferase/long-chain-fatty-acid--[acyl-carrier-protein] ligase
MGQVLVVFAVVCAAWALFAAVLARRLGIGFAQALLYAPLKLWYRIDDSAARHAIRAQGPVVYVIFNHATVDAAIAFSLLPPDTVHILDPGAAQAHWLDLYKALARTLPFNNEHLFVNRRLKRILQRKGRLAVYLPPEVEPGRPTFLLYRAIARSAQACGSAVVPVVFAGTEHAVSSRVPASEAPRRRFPRVRVSTLAPETLETTIRNADQRNLTATNALFDRVALARFHRHDAKLTLFEGFREAADRYGARRTILEDTFGEPLSYRRWFIGARVLGRRFAAITAPGEAVGVLLPNANGVAVTFLALQSAGRIAAMLNYTAGPASVASAIRTAKIGTVISSTAFIEKAQLEDIATAIGQAGAKIMWLEDVRKSLTKLEKLAAAAQWRRPIASTNASEPAVILFTSGSEGTPKGVVLSHRNLLANAQQAEARIAISVKDTLFNVLPVFHSFGLTGGTVLPLLFGVKLFLYPSPLHYKVIPQVAAKAKPTIMFGTDTFLSGYARTAKDSDFASLRFVVAGAEAVKKETRETYAQRFNTLILEGFGMTEAAPVVSVNSATHGSHGSVGRPLPGVDIRIEPVDGIENGGRLWVRGPNVMLGYMTADRPGELQPLAGEWHDSGDVVSLDREGFITIQGRLKRFAKIAGEMVSLGAVEMLVKSLWPEDNHAAIAVPDPRKGERIVLLTTAPKPERSALQAHSKRSGVPELMVPNEIIPVAEIPVLGSGKIDYVAVRKRVLEQPHG